LAKLILSVWWDWGSGDSLPSVLLFYEESEMN